MAIYVRGTYRQTQLFYSITGLTEEIPPDHTTQQANLKGQKSRPTNTKMTIHNRKSA